MRLLARLVTPISSASRPSSWSPITWRGRFPGRPAVVSRRTWPGCPHCTEYLAQMRETIRLTGRLAPEDLTPQMRDEFTDLYQRWRSDQQ